MISEHFHTGEYHKYCTQCGDCYEEVRPLDENGNLLPLETSVHGGNGVLFLKRKRSRTYESLKSLDEQTIAAAKSKLKEPGILEGSYLTVLVDGKIKYLVGEQSDCI